MGDGMAKLPQRLVQKRGRFTIVFGKKDMHSPDF
jgi:hypothetical protein